MSALTDRARVVDGVWLKLIALVTMTIDHAAAAMAKMGMRGDWYLPMRYIGRIAFPIFGFLLVEGYFHTRNRWKYLAQLLAVFALSEPVYDVTLRGKLPDWSNQNVLLTLSLGLGAIWLMEAVGSLLEQRRPDLVELKLAACLPFFALAELLRADYGYEGVAMIAAFCLFRHWPLCMCAAAFVPLFFGVSTMEIWALYAFVPILLYSGRRGRVLEGTGVKYFFYFYYPLHLAVILLVLRMLLKR